MPLPIKEIPTKPFEGRNLGHLVSGNVFQQEHYTENFIQATLDSIPPQGPQGATLVIGGDGRFFSVPTVETICRIAAANGVAKLIVGQNSILSTPAASNIIRKYKATGGILLTASHNPGGPDADFGIKYNVANGGPAPESVTNAIYERTKTLTAYKILEAEPVDLSKVGEQNYGPLRVQIIDSTADYVLLLKSIFDFDLIRSFLTSNRSFKVLFDGLHGVTGPYARALFLTELGLPESSVQNCVPSPNFGGGHPDPNLTYAHSLVDAVEKGNIPFGAASDGDGAFVTPSDSVAIIADWADAIPYFKKGGVKGLARSMPTSGAIDYVAKAKGFEVFEVPTGWKFFGNLMDAGRLSICGEESFGTGSDHIREKDGLWAVIAWLNILAAANEKKKGTGIKRSSWTFTRNMAEASSPGTYDYEEVSSEGAANLVAHLNKLFATPSFISSEHPSPSTNSSFTISSVSNFSYTDPIDASVSKNQGHIIRFSDGSRVVFRLSGTGSQGATVRMYVERYTKDESQYDKETSEGLKGLIEVALAITKLPEFLGRSKPTVITMQWFRRCMQLWYQERSGTLEREPRRQPFDMPNAEERAARLIGQYKALWP
ncbi:hypothetical protein BS47DRAFT_1372910 [Hydnum rufescens UP504]|uniref:phosphoglucomutase (alpha-D-glucose-1,6-bisphosphate-dependent) n=1 Tax=Hydnum rufescens UP504 TaxID=1448309 RepID=A0A9P6DVQ3_9AGAM|nr:hypothetical protein BS47DRAFT_1372910 [Hydnum rufescens UP504]